MGETICRLVGDLVGPLATRNTNEQIEVTQCRPSWLTMRTRFDTIKTRMQCAPPGTYRGALDILLKIMRHEVL